MTRALKAAAAVAGALILAPVLASVAVGLLALIAWPVLAVVAFGAGREALGDLMALNPREESPSWT